MHVQPSPPVQLVAAPSETEVSDEKKAAFDEYTSKTTGETYPGGKVERELEEVCDTASDFLLLAQGKAAPVRDD